MIGDVEQAAIVRVIDFETTGLPEDEGSTVCEVGLIDVDCRQPEFPVMAGSSWSSLINPIRPIPPEISAIHHIIDADVERMPYWDVAARALEARMTEHDVYGLTKRTSKSTSIRAWGAAGSIPTSARCAPGRMPPGIRTRPFATGSSSTSIAISRIRRTAPCRTPM
jgi:hypothetical protein